MKEVIEEAINKAFNVIQEHLDNEFPEGLFMYPVYEGEIDIKSIIDFYYKQEGNIRYSYRKLGVKEYDKCGSGNRSSGDLYAIVKGLIPTVTYREVAEYLWSNLDLVTDGNEHVKHNKFDKTFCRDAKKIVFRRGRVAAYYGYPGNKELDSEYDFLMVQHGIPFCFSEIMSMITKK